MAVVWIDGSCQHTTGEAACSAVFHGEGGAVFKEQLPNGTNPLHAEWAGLLLALREAGKRGDRRLHIYTDSRVLAGQVHGKFQHRHEREQYLEATNLIREFELVIVQYIPREKNRQADKAAQRARKQCPCT